MSVAPSEQLTPTISGRACSTETQKASDGLPREVAPAPVDRREREPERQLGRDVGGGDDRRLRVQRVEDRLDEEEVDAALRERGDLLGVALAHLVERDRAEARRRRPSARRRARR